MRLRRHHNNDGRQRIKSGGTQRDAQHLARKLGVPYGTMPGAGATVIAHSFVPMPDSAGCGTCGWPKENHL